MRALLCFLGAAALLWPQGAFAQIQPHRAEYALRLGAAANAARVGSAVQDLTLTCEGWQLKREVKGEIALTATWKMNVASKLDGEEQRGGAAFHYRTLLSQNGADHETRGKVQRVGEDLTAEIVSPTGPTQVLLPQPTLMPVALIEHVIEGLRSSAAAFPAQGFDPEGTGEAFRLDITRTDPGSIRGRRPADKPVAVPGKSWAVSIGFKRGTSPQQQKPLFTMTALLFESGVLDRLTVETPMAAVTADLQALEMRKAPTCSSAAAAPTKVLAGP